MRRTGRIGIAAAATIAAAGLWPGVANAQFTLTLAPSKDNTLFEDPNGQISNGAGPHLYVGLTGLGQIRRGAIAFDVSTIPSDASISSVTLTLHHSRSGPVGNAPVMLHRFLADWGEGSSFAPSPGGSGASATAGDVTWKHAFYDDVLWNTPGGDFSPTASASQNITSTIGSFDFTSAQLAADVQGWLANPETNFGWALIGNESAFGSAERFDTKEILTASQRPKLTIMYDLIAAGSTWNIDGGGAWGTAANWTGGVPDAQGAEAKFLDALTAAGAPAMVSLGADRTVGNLSFDNANSYLIDAASGQRLTLDNGASTGTIDVRGGTHSIRAQLRIAGPTDANIESRLNVPGGIVIEDGRTFVKRGQGTLDLGNGAGVQLGSGARLEVAAGVFSTASVRGGGALAIGDARVNIEPGGANASVLDSLEFTGEGTLDLTDNDLIIRATAATKESALAEVVSRIRSARNALAGRWEGEGITSTAAMENPLTTLAAMLNPGLETFAGETVGEDAILVKYTYNGDANLDGRINADDYFRIDSGFIEQPENPGYAQGDFNYDGTINADDYFLIDSAFLGQSGMLSEGISAVAAVPEPGTMIGFIAFGALWLPRRWRSRG